MKASLEHDAHVFRPAGEAVPLDVERLAAHLARIGMPLDPADPVRQFGTGMANINYRLTAGGRRLVLRRPPDGDLPPGAWREVPIAEARQLLHSGE